MAKGFEPWPLRKSTRAFVNEVLEVMEDQRNIWPRTQRYWLYRLSANLNQWMPKTLLSSFLPDYNRNHVPMIVDKKLITDVLKEFGLIEWNSEVKGWRIPLNVEALLIELRKNHEN